MIRAASTAAVLLLGVALRGAAPPIAFEEIPVPAATRATGGGVLGAGPGGAAWLAWWEAADGQTALRCAAFDREARQWSAARTIASSPAWVAGEAQPPALAVGEDGRCTVAWSVRSRGQPAGEGARTFFSRTADGGRTWSAPVLLTGESGEIESVALATLADGRVLAAWVGSRARERPGGRTQLFARIAGASGPEVLVGDSVCGGCPPALVAFPDGTALLAFRGRAEDDAGDVHVVRWRGGRWDAPRPLHREGWRLEACPADGPQLASDGGRVAVAWFTGAGGDPRVTCSFSPDAGTRFLLPLRISEVKPAGRPATVLLHDGAFFVVWVDAAGALWLRRVSPDYSAAELVRLTGPEEGRVVGRPRAALVRDYTGGRMPAEFLVAFAMENRPALRTLLVKVPEGEMIEIEQNCDCASSPDQLRGFPMRGEIAELRLAEGAVRIRHHEIPGIFAEGTRDFQVQPENVPAAALPGRQFLGRIEKRDGAWWLFDLRLIAGPPK